AFCVELELTDAVKAQQGGAVKWGAGMLGAGHVTGGRPTGGRRRGVQQGGELLGPGDEGVQRGGRLRGLSGHELLLARDRRRSDALIPPHAEIFCNVVNRASSRCRAVVSHTRAAKRRSPVPLRLL